MKQDLTEAQLDLLRHMLGINTPWDRTPRTYRNYAAATPGDSRFIELERIGAVVRYVARGGKEYHWYKCTEAGRFAAIRSHRDIRYGKAKRRYRKFLSVSDCCPDLTFKEFLTHPDFKDLRENA